MKENSIIILLFGALVVSQVITFVRLNELREISGYLINANSALYEAVRLQHEIDIIQSLRGKSFTDDETIYPLPRR